jgi:hypothetical protein
MGGACSTHIGDEEGFLSGTLHGTHSWRRCHSSRDNIKMEVKEIGQEVAKWIHVPQGRMDGGQSTQPPTFGFHKRWGIS